MEELISTIIVRPYVFIFLLAFLFLSLRRWGLAKTLLWLGSGYFLAWLSEYSSIHNGFPYGAYQYVYSNLQGELLVAGVPFFDSLSYTFLVFAGFTTAAYFLKSEHTLKTVFLGALLTMFLDVIIDPVATMGELWFLGKIHYYVYPGWYFGIPLSNFGGWFLVSLIIILFNLISWRFFPKHFAGHRTSLVVGKKSVLFPLFYLGIALFNILVTLWIRQWNLAVFSILILMTLLLTLLFLRVNVRQKKETWVPHQQQS